MISHLIEHSFFFSSSFLINRNSLELLSFLFWANSLISDTHTHTHTHIYKHVSPKLLPESGYSHEFIDIYISDYKH